MLDKYGKETTNDVQAWIKLDNGHLMVKGFRDSLVNPHTLASNHGLVWNKVDEDCFRNFEKFLVSQNDRFLINAQRYFSNNRAL